MDFKFLTHTVKNIILNPLKEWEVIFFENKSAALFSRSLFIPLLILVSVSAFLGEFLFANTELSDAYSVIIGIKYFIMLFLVVYGAAFILKNITGYLGLGRDFGITFKLVVCSVVPLLLCQIISQLFESFIFVNILSFFGIYILYEGIEKMLEPPDSKKLTLMIAATVSFIALFILVNWVLNMLTDKLYFSLFA